MVSRFPVGRGSCRTVLPSLLFTALVALLMLGSALPSGAAQLPAIKWSEPTVLQDYGDSSNYDGDADVATDAHGNAYFAWHDWRKVYGAPYARSRLADGTWTMGRNVDSEGWDEQNEVAPRIAADDVGNVFVAWVDQMSPGNDRVMLVRSPDSGHNWTDNVDVSANPTTSYELFDVAAGHGSTVLLLMGTPSFFQLRTSTNSGTTFSAALEVKSVSHPNFMELPELVATSSGETYLVYRLRTDPDWAIQVMSSTDDGRTFGAPMNVSTVYNASPARVFSPVVTATPGGQVAVAYTDTTYAGGEQRCKVTRSTDSGSTWSSPVLVDPQAEGGKGNDANCYIALAPDGTLYALYYHNDDRDVYSGYKPYLRALRPDGTWTDRADLTPLLLFGGHGMPHGLSVDGLGRLHMLLEGNTYSLDVDNTVHFLGTLGSGGDGGGDGDGDGDGAKVTDFALFWAVLALMLVFLLLAVIGFARRPKQPAASQAPPAYQSAPQPYYPQAAPPPPVPPPAASPPPQQPPRPQP